MKLFFELAVMGATLAGVRYLAGDLRGMAGLYWRLSVSLITVLAVGAIVLEVVR